MTNKKKKIKAAKKIPNKWAEGPTVSESYDGLNPDIISKYPFKWRLKAQVIDAPAYIRGPPKKIPPYDGFLAYLEFRANQKPTFIERIFGKRMLP